MAQSVLLVWPCVCISVRLSVRLCFIVSEISPKVCHIFFAKPERKVQSWRVSRLLDSGGSPITHLAPIFLRRNAFSMKSCNSFPVSAILQH